MTVIVAAVNLKTESGDDYLFCEKASYINEIIKRAMGEELECVYNYSIATFPFCSETNNEIRNKLRNDIDGE